MTDFNDTFEIIDQLISRQMAEDGTPGVALALTDRKKVLRVANYGFADVAAQCPVTDDILFEIGSIGKSFTALALLQLQEAGQVDIQAPVTAYLPWFQVRSNYPPITLHHLLSHTAGLIEGTDFAPDSPYQVWALREQEVSFSPGERFHYSNIGYKLLGLLLEGVLNQGYGQIIQERLLEPLGMAATDPIITHKTRHRLAVGYQPWYDDRPRYTGCPLAPATWLETNTGDGSIASTATDMAAYLRLLMNRGQGPAGPIISEKSFELMSQRVIEIESEPGTYYGYGLDIETNEGHTYLGHSGDMVGYRSAILADMELGLGVVLLSNGPFKPVRTSHSILNLLRAVSAGSPLPHLPPEQPPTRIENAADYAGIYRGATGTLSLVAEGESLSLEGDDESILFERSGEDSFYLNHPDYERYLWYFRREPQAEAPGPVVEVVHGPDWYSRKVDSDFTPVNHPAEWAAYPGHYRSHNPWISNFRVVLRRGELILIQAWGEEQPLVPLGEGHFRVGEEIHSPERLRFDTIVNGKALRANYSGCEYYWFFTP
jgi:D-alanyl-D-alanine carboxypeptidase